MPYGDCLQARRENYQERKEKRRVESHLNTAVVQCHLALIKKARQVEDWLVMLSRRVQASDIFYLKQTAVVGETIINY